MSGTVSDFTPTRVLALKSAVALAAGGVSPELVTISVTSASVKVVAVIRMPGLSGAAVQARAEALRADLQTAARASTVLGVTVIGTPAVLDITPVGASSLTGLPTGATVAIVVGLAALVVALGMLTYRCYHPSSRQLLLGAYLKQGGGGHNAARSNRTSKPRGDQSVQLPEVSMVLHEKGTMASSI